MLIIIFLLIFLSNTWCADLLIPDKKTYIKVPYVYIILKINTHEKSKIEPEDAIEPELLHTPKKGNYIYLHYYQELNPGENILRISPEGKEIKIFYKPRGTYIPPYIKPFKFHYKKREKECMKCHTISPEIKEGKPTCYLCHNKMVKDKKWVHGPVARWWCLNCHDSKYNKSGKRFDPLFQESDKMCFYCHTSKRRWMTERYIHGPVATGNCVACHDPHASNHKFFLWAQARMKLCIFCHVEKGKEFASPGYKFHGIIVGLGCNSCHSPHASEYPYQLYAKIIPLCVSCHTEYKKVKVGHPIPGHPISGPRDPLRPNKKFTCASCHNPHGSIYEKLLIGMNGSDLCFKCHKF